MSTEEIKMIIDLLSNAGEGVKEVVIWFFALSFAKSLLMFFGVIIGIMLIVKLLKSLMNVISFGSDVMRLINSARKTSLKVDTMSDCEEALRYLSKKLIEE